MRGFVAGLVVGVMMSATLAYGVNLTDDVQTMIQTGVMMCWDRTANGKLNAILKKLNIIDWTNPDNPHD